jgi:hypothetical protein
VVVVGGSAWVEGQKGRRRVMVMVARRRLSSVARRQSVLSRWAAGRATLAARHRVKTADTARVPAFEAPADQTKTRTGLHGKGRKGMGQKKGQQERNNPALGCCVELSHGRRRAQAHAQGGFLFSARPVLVFSCLVLSDLVWSCPVWSCFVLCQERTARAQAGMAMASEPLSI